VIAQRQGRGVRCRRLIVRTSALSCSDEPAGDYRAAWNGASVNLGMAVGEPYSLPDLGVACLDKHRKSRAWV
jgi:hypothetical protein